MPSYPHGRPEQSLHKLLIQGRKTERARGALDPDPDPEATSRHPRESPPVVAAQRQPRQPHASGTRAGTATLPRRPRHRAQQQSRAQATPGPSPGSRKPPGKGTRRKASSRGYSPRASPSGQGPRAERETRRNSLLGENPLWTSEEPPEAGPGLLEERKTKREAGNFQVPLTSCPDGQRRSRDGCWADGNPPPSGQRGFQQLSRTGPSAQGDRAGRDSQGP